MLRPLSAVNRVSEFKHKKLPDKPEVIADTALEMVDGGGLLDTSAGTFGFEPITLERGAKVRYIGETEKNVWKAPAGVTHDEAFED